MWQLVFLQMGTARPYRSALRAEQASRTRERIVDAAVAELDEERDVIIPAVARRAGVAVRTVYHHFPSKKQLIAAILHRYEARFGTTFDAAPDDLPELWAQRARAFAQDAALARAVVHIAPGDFAAEREQRVRALTKVLSPLLDGRPASERRRIAAAFYIVQGVHTWHDLHAYVGLSAGETAKTIHWMTTALLAALARDERR
jgi:AcrR family transcriptional regulator